MLPHLAHNPFLPAAFALALPGLPLLHFRVLAPPPQQLKTLFANSRGQGLGALLFQPQELLAMQHAAMFGGGAPLAMQQPAEAAIAAMGHAAPAV